VLIKSGLGVERCASRSGGRACSQVVVVRDGKKRVEEWREGMQSWCKVE
jgi:hypothetical protein